MPYSFLGGNVRSLRAPWQFNKCLTCGSNSSPRVSKYFREMPFSSRPSSSFNAPIKSSAIIHSGPHDAHSGGCELRSCLCREKLCKWVGFGVGLYFFLWEDSMVDSLSLFLDSSVGKIRVGLFPGQPTSTSPLHRKGHSRNLRPV